MTADVSKLQLVHQPQEGSSQSDRSFEWNTRHSDIGLEFLRRRCSWPDIWKDADYSSQTR